MSYGRDDLLQFQGILASAGVETQWGETPSGAAVLEYNVSVIDDEITESMHGEWSPVYSPLQQELLKAQENGTPIVDTLNNYERSIWEMIQRDRENK